ncbi:MFS transporter [Crenobacter sp. SG2305]|uniref:MFS transporter n=1 Tax=Crenobacter oryzisoli TaxID=3056844 RepID=UPI0025AB2DB9|nr:MFS transporter [Crenobacter sp. SG2305]MDN0081760.1 MFS transporter [Crenobacter sp. SG2305]
MQKMSVLNRSTLLFPLALVLFEFSVYIANDMIQPGMVMVVREFGVDSAWIPTAMTAFLLGGALFPWLMGPLSDRVGRRPVMLGGALFFVLSCLATLVSTGIESFTVLRVLQGVGLCFISAVGYTTVQEAFEEKAAVKVMALMANVALIAPLVGPVVGAALIAVWPWRMTFALIAAVAAVALFGLLRKMPETLEHKTTELSLRSLKADYLALLKNRRFMSASLTIPLLALPLLGWIALSPVFLIEQAGMSPVEYGLWQFPVFGALITGNLVLVRITDRLPLGLTVLIGLVPLLSGMALMFAGCLFSSVPHYFIIAGISLMALAEGLSFAVLYRFALTSSGVSKGATAAAIGMVGMVVYVLGIEGFSRLHQHFGDAGFAAMALSVSLCYAWLARRVVARAMADRAEQGEAALEPQLAGQDA